MSILIKKDLYKLKIETKLAFTMMITVSFVLLYILISNVVWILDYDEDAVRDNVIAIGKPGTNESVSGYVRLKALFGVMGNTLILGSFFVYVWWGMNKKPFGLGFGLFWMIMFGVNAISMPLYSVQTDAFSIIGGILHGVLAIGMIVWIVGLLQHRTRLKEEVARRAK